MWNLEYDTDKPKCEIETDSQTSENGLAVADGEAGRGGMNWESAVGRCRLLYRTGSSREQFPLIAEGTAVSVLWQTKMGENTKKNVCVCETEALCWTSEVNMTF